MEVFVVNSGEIEGRIDPEYYSDFNVSLKKKILKAYGKHVFGEVIEDIYRYPTFYNISYLTSGIPVIKGENITDDGLIDLNQDFDFIDAETNNKFHRTQLQKGDLVFTVRGVVGKVGLFEGFNTVGNINANVIKIRIKNGHNPKFFWIYLNSDIGQALIKKQTSGQVQKTITVPDIRKIYIPSLPLTSQNEIVLLMQNAYEEKRQKEAEASELLQSVDTYVMKELGIKLPQIKREMCFVVNYGELRGRLDPLYYSKDIFKMLNKVKYDIKLIGDIILYLKTGFAAGKHGQSKIEGKGVIQIRPTNVNRRGRLYFERNIYLDEGLLNEKDNELLIIGEVLFNNTNSQGLVGKSAMFNLKDNYFCSNHITRIGTNKNLIIPEYLWILLNVYQKLNVFYNLCTNWNNQSGVNIELLKTIKIPLPPLNIQTEIAEEVKRRTEKAEALKREAASVLENTKKEVDNMILG